MALISIIVPVFNCEKYLSTCIDSILGQTFKNFELILVDDGSTDDSLRIIENYAMRDKRISVIKQRNMHAGVARNNGLIKAKGKYVIFLDSDDFFKPRMLEILYNTAEKYNAQIVQFYSYKYENESRQICIDRKMPVRTRVVSARDLGKNIFRVCNAVPWDKFILKSFLMETGIKYQDIQNSNDEYFNRMIVTLAERIVLLNKRLVYYRVNNPTSIQGNQNKDLLCDALAIANLKKNLESRDMLNGDIKDAYFDWAMYLLNHRFMAKGSNESRIKLYDYLKSNAIPDIIDTIDDITPECTLYRVIKSNDYEDFLIKELQYVSLNAISVNSMEYKVCHRLLNIARKMRI